MYISYVCYVYSPAACLRFGVALAKCRTLHAKRIQRRAKAFLRSARATTSKFDMRPRVNRAWVNGAKLQPVLDFLAGK